MIKKVFLLTLIALIFSCSEDDLNYDGQQQFTQSQLIELAESSPESALAISEGIEGGQYAFMIQYSTNSANTGGRHDDFGQKSIDLGLDLMSNDMVQVADHWFGNYYTYRGRTQDFSTTSIIWNFYYKIIQGVNDVIGQIPADTDNESLMYVRARSTALRAFAYFNLARIYQYSYQQNSTAPGIPLYAREQDISEPSRTPLEQVYTLIMDDINYAYNHLDGYTDSSKQTITKAVAAGLYARILLETGTDYNLCASMANEAKSAGSLMTGTQWATDGFDNIGNSEWIWGADITAENSTIYASYFSHVGTNNQGYAGLLGIYKTIDSRLYNEMADTDLRKTAFGGASDLYKNYKFFDETFFQGDYVYMRVAEMYLMEAEALARAGNDAGAAQVLYDLVSTRDPGYVLSSNTGQSLIDEILIQRRIELWGEGFAWFDMKRTGKALERNYSNTNHPIYGRFDFAFGANEFKFQIPEIELINNDEIGDLDQNPL